MSPRVWCSGHAQGNLALGFEADGEHNVDECGWLSQRLLEGHARIA
jgi:hypothetical protein